MTKRGTMKYMRKDRESVAEKSQQCEMMWISVEKNIY
jgi:hypothetical protein